VGREAELTQLHQWLEKAANGQRQLVFIAGEPGIGKTTLVEAFLRSLGSRVQSREEESQNAKVKTQKSKVPDLKSQIPKPGAWVARGQCIEHYGSGEAYLPVLEALYRLCQQPGQERLLPLLRQYAPMWLAQLPTLLTSDERASLQREIAGCTRERMLRELAVLLEALTTDTTLVLVLEDLHWSDLSTLDLLAMLARRSEPTRLLVVGTYRSSEVHTQNHPLSAVLQELQAHALCHELRVEGLTEVAVIQYLDQRFPVRAFPTRFTRVLHQRTEGNPLFLVNLVEDLIQQGVLTDGVGGWTFQGTLDTLAHHVPAGSRQLITKLIGQVQPAIHQTLAAGSVTGFLFSAAAVAAALDTTASEVERQCEEAVRRQLFIERAGIAVWPDGTEAARYGFRHALYQQLWHEQVSISQQQEWHQRIGIRKELAYPERTSEIAAELAVHFTQGRDSQRAVHYLRQAAEQAMLKAAPREALQHVTEAVTLLQTLPDTQERSQQELALRVMQGALLIAVRGYAVSEVGQTYTRARELCQQVGRPAQLFHILWGLYAFHAMRAEVEMAQALEGQIYTVAQSVADPALLVNTYVAVGSAAFHRGEYERAREQLACGTAIPPPQSPQASPLTQSTHDPWVMCLGYEAWALAPSGYPEQAKERIDQTLCRAQALAHPFSLVTCHEGYCHIAYHRREPQVVAEHAEAMMVLATEHGFPQRLANGQICRGWALAQQQQTEEGIEQIRRGLAAYRAVGVTRMVPYFLAFLAEAALRGRQITEGLTAVNEALELTQQTGERFSEAELWRLKGELLLAQEGKEESQKAKGKRQRGTRGWGLGAGSSSPQAPSLKPQVPSGVVEEVEGYFLKAIEVARQQSAKLLELRATVSLVRLRQHQAQDHATRTTQHDLPTKLAEARTMLSDLYNWFTEGFDTKDLQEAKALIEELSH
jgi:predicted ATPase